MVCSWGRGEDGLLGHGDAEVRHLPLIISAFDDCEISSAGLSPPKLCTAGIGEYHCISYGPVIRIRKDSKISNKTCSVSLERFVGLM